MTAPEPTPTAEHTDAVALERRHREAGAECALWNQANLVGQAIDRGRLDGTDGAAVAAAIRARTPEEFAKACGEVSPTAEHTDAVALVIESAWSDGDDAKIAHRILTSTDPAVHAAILAALVRAGVLTEFRIDALLNEDGSLTTDAYIEHCNVVARQFVTPWEVAP